MHSLYLVHTLSLLTHSVFLTHSLFLAHILSVFLSLSLFLHRLSPVLTHTLPLSQAKALAEMGQFAIACRPHNDRLWDMLAAYGNEMHIFLMILNITGLILYFITSSDSGSNPNPPLIP